MNRQELAAYLTETYGINGEHLFARYPSFQVFRHTGNKKWFAVLMDIPRKNLGLTGEGEISIVNLKCDPRLIGSFRMEPGIFPGWHMNKAHWLAVAMTLVHKKNCWFFATSFLRLCKFFSTLY